MYTVLAAFAGPSAVASAMKLQNLVVTSERPLERRAPGQNCPRDLYGSRVALSTTEG